MKNADKLDNPAVSLAVAVAATLFAFSVAYAIYFWRAAEMWPYHTARTVGYFHFHFDWLTLPAVLVFIGWVSLHGRAWIPSSIAIILGWVILVPVFASSGASPDIEIEEALHGLHMFVVTLAIFLNGVLLTIWHIARQRRRLEKEPCGHPEAGNCTAPTV